MALVVLLVLSSSVVLTGCAGSAGGTSVSDVAAALANDKANACVTVTNAFPPYAGSFTYIHQGDPSSQSAPPTCK